MFKLTPPIFLSIICFSLKYITLVPSKFPKNFTYLLSYLYHIPDSNLIHSKYFRNQEFHLFKKYWLT